MWLTDSHHLFTHFSTTICPSKHHSWQPDPWIAEENKENSMLKESILFEIGPGLNNLTTKMVLAVLQFRPTFLRGFHAEHRIWHRHPRWWRAWLQREGSSSKAQFLKVRNLIKISKTEGTSLALFLFLDSAWNASSTRPIQVCTLWNQKCFLFHLP